MGLRLLGDPFVFFCILLCPAGVSFLLYSFFGSWHLGFLDLRFVVLGSFIRIALQINNDKLTHHTLAVYKQV
jgi:hypothetical protein